MGPALEKFSQPTALMISTLVSGRKNAFVQTQIDSCLKEYVFPNVKDPRFSVRLLGSACVLLAGREAMVSVPDVNKTGNGMSKQKNAYVLLHTTGGRDRIAYYVQGELNMMG